MQTELFEISDPTTVSESEAPAKTSFLETKLMTLRIDHTIGLLLIMMVVFVLSFAWGVERGKGSVRNSQAATTATPPALPETAQKTTAQEDVPTIAEKIANAPAATVPTKLAVLPTPKAEKQPASGERPNGKYTIQHVIYLTQSAAERESKKLQQKGHRAFIIPSGKYLQVCLDGFATKKEADRALKMLRTQGTIAQDAYVRNMPA